MIFNFFEYLNDLKMISRGFDKYFITKAINFGYFTK